MPPLTDLRFEQNEIDGRFELRYVAKVQLWNNSFTPERGQLTLRDCREVSLKGNRQGREALPTTHIKIL